MAIFGQFFQRQFWIDGELLTDGKLYHYAAGTATDKDMYSDREKTTPEAQPLVSNGDGIFTAYADGLYKLVLTGSEGLSDVIYTWDNVMVTQVDIAGEGASLASASTLVLGTDGTIFHVTGTTTINAISGDQPLVTLVFDDSLTITNSANIIIVGGIDFVTASDGSTVKQFLNEGGGVWREIALSLNQIVTDMKIKKNTPRIRMLGTEASAQEFAITESAGDMLIQYNIGTEGSPSWDTRLQYDSSALTWIFTGKMTLSGNFESPTIITPTITVPVIASFANATHNHTNAAGGGLLGSETVGSSQVKLSAQSSVSGNITDNVGGSHQFTVTGQRVTEFSIDPSTGNGGSCTLQQIHPATTDAASTTWLLTVAGDGVGAGTTTYTISWSILGTVT